MALTSSEKNEIEVLIRKEIRDFMNSNTIRQFEEKMMDEIRKELKRGKLESEVKDIVVKMMKEFYQTLWVQRSFWESRVKSA